MDELDIELLGLVQANSRQSYGELGRRVGLSVSAVNERLKKLQARGVIAGYTARVNARAVGLDICAFVQVLIDRPGNEPGFVEAVAAMAAVEECHHVTGDYSYLLKLRARDTRHLESLISASVKAIPGVVRSQTLIALSSPKEAGPLDCSGG